jgi:hypothetical protein
MRPSSGEKHRVPIEIEPAGRANHRRFVNSSKESRVRRPERLQAKGRRQQNEFCHATANIMNGREAIHGMKKSPNHQCLSRWAIGQSFFVAVVGLVVISACSKPAEPTVDPSSSSLTPTSEAVANDPASPRKPLPPDVLRQRLELAIEHVRSRQLQTTNSFWTVFHGILGLGPNVEIIDPNTQVKTRALSYIFGGDHPLGEIRGARFVPTADGLDVSIGPTHVGQGHQDQFIAEIAQWGVPKDTPVVVFGKQYSMMDFVKESMAHSRVGQELSWSTVVIASYVGTDVEWTNKFGEKLNFEQLLESEWKASIDQAACGGTHRLFGMTWCYFTHRRNGGDVEKGIWKKVKEKLDAHVELAKKYQNPDGSFSSNHFRGPGATTDLSDNLASSGHIFEWLASHLPDTAIRETWMQDACMAVSLMILDAKDLPMESGALYHATHGLITYHQRMFKAAPDTAPPTPEAISNPAPEASVKEGP